MSSLVVSVLPAPLSPLITIAWFLLQMSLCAFAATPKMCGFGRVPILASAWNWSMTPLSYSGAISSFLAYGSVRTRDEGTMQF